MLQAKYADDYIVATGETHSVKEFLDEVFKMLDIKLSWDGNGFNKKAINSKNGKLLVEIDKSFYNGDDIFDIRGDASKAIRELGWSPRVSFIGMIKGMLEYELNYIRN